MFRIQCLSADVQGFGLIGCSVGLRFGAQRL